MANWIDNIAGKMGYTKTAVKYPQWLLDMAEAERWNVPPPELFKNQAELYQRLSWINAAVGWVSSYSSTIPLNVLRKKGEKTQDVDNHEFELLLHHPNPLNSRYEFLRSTYAFILLTGNAYWYLNKPNEKAKPIELWVIPPSRITPIPDGRQYIKGYEYDPGGGQTLTLEPWQIVHFHDFHPNNEFVGLSKVEPVAMVAATDLNQQKWTGELYGKNNGRLPGIIAFADKINQPDWEQIQKNVKDSASSRNYMMLQAVGKGGVEILTAAATIKDMEMLNNRAFTKEEIFSVFAPGLASVLAINATEANARTGKATLIEFCVYPMQVAVAEKITNQIMPLYQSANIYYTAQFEDIRITDRAIEMQELQVFALSHTIDEIRGKYYEDDPLAKVTKVESDNRGIMLPAQVSSGTPVPSDDEPDPVPQQLQPFQQVPVEEQPKEVQEQPGEETGEQMGEEAAEAEAKAWRKFALKRIGKPAREFDVKHIDGKTAQRIREGLKGAKTEAEINAVFDDPGAVELPPDAMMLIAMELKRANDLLERTEG